MKIKIEIDDSANNIKYHELDIIYSFDYKFVKLKDIRYHVDKEIYSSFLRLNNRRKTQSDADFLAAGYKQVGAAINSDPTQIDEWCCSQFGKHGFYRSNFNNWWFTNDADETLFRLTWL